MLSTILVVLLILLLIGALPAWPYSASWGYAPGGGAWHRACGRCNSCLDGTVVSCGKEYWAKGG